MFNVPDGMEMALFAMGCFWRTERLFWQLPGVCSTKFRQQALAVRKKENLTFKQRAWRFRVGIATVMRRHKNPQPVIKRHKSTTKINRELSAQDVAENLGVFLHERADRLAVTGTGIAHVLLRTSLPGGAGYGFRDRTLTCKIRVAFPGAPLSGTKTHFVFSINHFTDCVRGPLSVDEPDWQLLHHTLQIFIFILYVNFFVTLV